MNKQFSNIDFFTLVEEKILQGSPVRIRMKGVSMLPLLREGKDEVLIAPCLPEELRKGKVLLFRYGGKHILHRIIQREGNLLIMKGDGSIRATEKIDIKDVVGMVTHVYRPSGRIISTSSFSWKLKSRLWNSLGFTKRIILKVL